MLAKAGRLALQDFGQLGDRLGREEAGSPGEHLLIGGADRDEQRLILPPLDGWAGQRDLAQQAPDLDAHRSATRLSRASSTTAWRRRRRCWSSAAQPRTGGRQAATTLCPARHGA